jgi:hypothetical protein
MKDNTIKSKQLLEQAFKLMPRDFALSNARAYLTRAINEVTAFEKKQERKNGNTVAPTNALPPMTAVERDNALEKIENMIADEEKKLKAILERKNNRRGTDPSQTLNG